MFEKLIGLLGSDENKEALAIAKSLQGVAGELTAKINNLELKNTEVISSRDKTKGQLKLVKDKLGLIEITEDSLSSINSSKPDEKSKLEIENLQLELKKVSDSSIALEDNYKSRLSSLILKTEINKTNLPQLAVNPESYAILEGLVLKNATCQDDKIVFLNDDGTTAYAGSVPMSLETKVSSLVENQAYAGLFKPQISGGGGESSSSNGGGNKKFSELTENERVALFKRDPEGFKRLSSGN